MALPVAYDEESLIALMVQKLGRVAGVLEWVAPGSYQEIVNDVLVEYGVADLAGATDLVKLRALTLRALWAAAVDGLSDLYDVQLDGQDLKRSQLYKNAVANRDYWTLRAAAYVTENKSYIRTARYPDDPYVYVDDEERPA